jgi:VCBS repeat protein
MGRAGLALGFVLLSLAIGNAREYVSPGEQKIISERAQTVGYVPDFNGVATTFEDSRVFYVPTLGQLYPMLLYHRNTTLAVLGDLQSSGVRSFRLIDPSLAPPVVDFHQDPNGAFGAEEQFMALGLAPGVWTAEQERICAQTCAQNEAACVACTSVALLRVQYCRVPTAREFPSVRAPTQVPGEPYRLRWYFLIPLGSDVQSAAIGDVTGDGRPDVVAMSSSSFGGQDHHVFVFAQREDGTLLGGFRVYPYRGDAEGESGGSGLVLADLDENGVKDVVIGLDAGFVVLRADGAGGLLPPEPHEIVDGVARYADVVSAMDVNLDGHLDILTMGVSSRGHIYFGDGHGSFTQESSFDDSGLQGQSVSELQVEDLNSDGLPDLAMLQSSAHGNELQIDTQNGLGTLARTGLYSITPNELGLGYAGGVGLGDINGDGRPDVVVSANRTPAAPDRLWILTQNEQHHLDCPQLIPTSEEPDSVKIADLDGDGRKDIVVLHPDHLGYYLQRPDGLLEPEQLVPGPLLPRFGAHALAVGDITSDGCLDAVIAGGTEGLAVFYGCGGPRGVPALSAGMSVVLVALGCLFVQGIGFRQRGLFRRRRTQPEPNLCATPKVGRRS